MNKLLMICLCAFLCFAVILSGCKAGNVEIDYTGMSYAEFTKLVPEDSRFDYLGYAFFEDAQGNPCVVYISSDKVSEFRSFSKRQIDTSAAAFNEIQPGMSIYDLVAKVGLPTKTATFGMATLIFESKGGEYTIVLNTATSPVTVASVESP